MCLNLCGEPCWYRCCSFFKSKIRKDHLFVMKIYDYFIYIICSLCLNFFHLLARKLNLQKIIIFIQTNSFIIIYWSKSSFTCPGLWASELVFSDLRFKKRTTSVSTGLTTQSKNRVTWLKGEVRENLGDFRKSIQILTFLSPLPYVPLPFTKRTCCTMI
jgi:hypothetical protein